MSAMPAKTTASTRKDQKPISESPPVSSTGAMRKVTRVLIGPTSLAPRCASPLQSLRQLSVLFSIQSAVVFSSFVSFHAIGNGTMARINIIKQIKIVRQWVFKAIPAKKMGSAIGTRCPKVDTSSKWRESGRRVRLPAGRTVSQALESRRIKKAELAATDAGILQRYKPVVSPPPPEQPFLLALIRRYLDQTDRLKKPNTYRKYNAVLTRFENTLAAGRWNRSQSKSSMILLSSSRKAGYPPTPSCTT